MSHAVLDRLRVTRPVGCQLLGLTARKFSRLEDSGVFTAVEPGRGQRGARYEAPALVAAFLAHALAKVGGLEIPRDRKDTSQAELNELRLMRERRLLLPRDQVVAEGIRYIAACQSRLRAIAPALRQEAAADDATIAKVSGLIEGAIEEFAGWRSALAIAEAEDA